MTTRFSAAWISETISRWVLAWEKPGPLGSAWAATALLRWKVLRLQQIGVRLQQVIRQKDRL
jgi:hypothetical protein